MNWTKKHPGVWESECGRFLISTEGIRWGGEWETEYVLEDTQRRVYAQFGPTKDNKTYRFGSLRDAKNHADTIDALKGGE